MMKKQVLGFQPASRLKMSTTKIQSTCRIANIGPDDATILALLRIQTDRIFGSDRERCSRFALTSETPH
jgi:hypothetical protein